MTHSLKIIDALLFPMSRPESSGKKPPVVTVEQENEAQGFSSWLRRQGSRSHRRIADNTVIAYTKRIRRLLADVGMEPNAETVSDFVDTVTKGRKNSTYNGFVFAIKSYSKYRISVGKTNGFAEYLRSQSTDDREVKDPITRRELDALIAEATKRDDETFALFLGVAWDTLGRAEELVSLTWGDIAFKPNAKMNTQATVTFADGKTGRGLHGYLWSPGLAASLKAYKPKDAKDSDPVFRDLAYDAADYRLETYAVAVGIERKVHLHLIRAGAAVWLDSKNAPLSVIMLMGRWKSLAAVQRYLRADEGLVGETLAKALGAAEE
jgi:integrase